MIMYTFLLLIFCFLPIIYGERQQTEFDNNQRMFMPHSVAAAYLLRLPIRQYQNTVLDSRIDSSPLLMSSDQNDPDEQQRTKRIYWENLAFHAADFKKPKRFK
ncbi:unnamed protein product [Rotaria sordida]|nr:unnamed protein product [Rotaria sordida]CAF0879650.1 unnamed protein product [Rotaria sordida]CAF0906137.1 unnamed protein product [Rotaria sordida]CAF0927375.1 unnamed protein product [Rotaria sordida]